MKKIIYKWVGTLGNLIVKHIELRRSLGAVYKANELVLYRFHQYLNRHYPGSKMITRQMIKCYLDSKTTLTPWGRRNTVIYIRQFCRFLNQRGKDCYIPDKTLLPKLRYQVRYYPLTKVDVKAIMNAAHKSMRIKPMLRNTYVTMIGIAWCAGLRRNEIVKLNHGDIDLERNTILIRETKFRKSRLVPIKKSTAQALTAYIEAKKQTDGYETSYRSALFMNRYGKRMSASNLGHMFKRFTQRAGIKTRSGTRHARPSLHDLRHSFATRNLNRFYNESEGLPPQAYLPVLATYLGHSDLVYSQYYLHPDFDLLTKASKKFEKLSQRGEKK